MTLDLARILRSKREFRQRLAARPIEEKLAMLDALRERTLAIVPASRESQADALHEAPPAYPVKSRHPNEPESQGTALD